VIEGDLKPRLGAGTWRQNPERGSALLLRAVTHASLRLGRPFGRLVVLVAVAYYFLFAPTARRHSREYLRRVLGRAPGTLDQWRQFLSFGTTILDRIYLINGRYELFDVSIEGEELMREVVARGNGAFLLGSHLGGFEIVSALGRHQPGLKVSMAMFEENARKMSQVLHAVNPDLKLEIIPLGQPAAMLALSDCLERGHFVGILADRTIAEQPALAVSFLGSPALFPLGPLRLAAVLRRPVIFMLGLYRGGNRYQVVFEQIADFSATPRAGREQAVRLALGRYVELLERYCRSCPYNWFNFYDFWQGATT
jgi:predicted LPLAT superfamily acyltransferase